MSQRARIESIVGEIVGKMDPGAGAYKLRGYISAALDIYGSLYGVHRWGDEAPRAMAADEFKRTWLSKWSAEGLDPGVLEAIYGVVRPVIDALGRERSRVRMQFIREKYAKW